MQFPAPIFIGFRAKIVNAQSAFAPREVCSMSDCVNDMPPDWVDRWDFNRASCYNSEQEAWATVPSGSEDHYVMFAYRMFPIEYSDSDSTPIDLKTRLTSGTEIAPEPKLSGYHQIGFDVANGPTYDPEDYPPHQEGFSPVSGSLGFGCSPLSCNGCAQDFPVNQYYLLDDLNTAVRAAKEFAKKEPEPGPYYIYEVLRKMP